MLAPTGQSNIASEIALGVYGFVILLIGVFLGAVHNRLKAEKDGGASDIAIGKVIAVALRTPDFWLGIFAAPVVYVILLQAVDLETVSAAKIFALTLVGLQNGFVCNTAADGLISKGAPQTTNSGG